VLAPARVSLYFRAVSCLAGAEGGAQAVAGGEALENRAKVTLLHSPRRVFLSRLPEFGSARTTLHPPDPSTPVGATLLIRRARLPDGRAPTRTHSPSPPRPSVEHALLALAEREAEGSDISDPLLRSSPPRPPVVVASPPPAARVKGGADPALALANLNYPNHGLFSPGNEAQLASDAKALSPAHASAAGDCLHRSQILISLLLLRVCYARRPHRAGPEHTRACGAGAGRAA
jgi:hypothetical protein